MQSRDVGGVSSLGGHGPGLEAPPQDRIVGKALFSRERDQGLRTGVGGMRLPAELVQLYLTRQGDRHAEGMAELLGQGQGRPALPQGAVWMAERPKGEGQQAPTENA